MTIAPVSGDTLVADIGGTNARFAIATPVGLQKIATLAVAHYDHCGDAIDDYLRHAGVSESDLGAACFAVASPVGAGEIRFTNSPWRFTRESLVDRFRFPQLRLINDFEALALQVPHCPANALQTLRVGGARPESARVVLGPGTGLGVAGLVPVASAEGAHRWQAVPGEGGHVAFAPADEFEVELLRYLQTLYGRVSVERIASGPGLTDLYRFLCRRDGASPIDERPEAIAQRALAAADSRSLEAVKRFLAVVGGFAGDAALMFGAVGGVYLGGGILPKLLAVVSDSDFFVRFNAKGRYESWVEQIPIHLITDDTAALRGAALALAGHGRGFLSPYSPLSRRPGG